MKAHELITKSTSFNPDQIKVMCEAFDGAWKHVAPGVRTRPASIEAARLKLAEVILNLARDGLDGDQLEEAALERMFTAPRRL
jgi:hypothetical protein